MSKREDFQRELQGLINRYSMENGSDTPDFILASFLLHCLTAFDQATISRDYWYRREDSNDANP